MEAVIEFLQANPLYAAGAAVLIVLFVVSLFMKAVKLIVIALVLNLGYGYYVQDMAEDAYAKANSTIESAVDTAVDTAKDMLDQ